LAGIQITPIPHFSWHVAEGYDLKKVRPALEEIAKISEPFIIRSTGLGLFSGDKPVVFISLVKDVRLLRFHQLVWDKISPAADRPSPYYSPESWMPHITLAHGDLDANRVVCAMEKLAFRSFNWEILVDNIALINQDEGHVGKESLRFKFAMKGKP
jgi:2'-5' RNA ligase